MLLWAGTLGSNLTIAGAPALFVAKNLAEKEDQTAVSLKEFLAISAPYVADFAGRLLHPGDARLGHPLRQVGHGTEGPETQRSGGLQKNPPPPRCNATGRGFFRCVFLLA